MFWLQPPLPDESDFPAGKTFLTAIKGHNPANFSGLQQESVRAGGRGLGEKGLMEWEGEEADPDEEVTKGFSTVP